ASGQTGWSDSDEVFIRINPIKSDLFQRDAERCALLLHERHDAMESGHIASGEVGFLRYVILLGF
ncbi:hypothetical protein OH407_24095, partial [Salmonella enterica]|uniref:hypothetical protein n=1 Tax=Salmonella enterica TaxID=28901 RepID=UPI0022B6692E